MSTRMPPWATKTVNAYENQGDSTFVTSTRQSANLFRIECARIWHQRIHQAQRKAWTRTVQDMLEYKAKENAMVESTTAQLEHYSLTPSGPNEYDRHFEEEFLPMTIVSPPPACRLDRQALTEAMWDLYRGGRCCSLWLPRLLSTTHSTLHLLARQCVSIPAPSDQEFQNQASRYFRKHQRKRHASMKQILLWWAARTKAFDSMVIVLEVIHLYTR